MRPPVNRSDMKDFYRRLAQAFYRSDKTIHQFAKDIGKSEKTVNMYLMGRSTPDAQVLRRICDTLDVSADWLVLGDERRSPKWWI